MKHRDNHIKGGKHSRAKHRLLDAIEVVVTIRWLHIHLRALGEQCGDVAIVGYIKKRVACIETPLLGYIYRCHVILLAVDGMHGLRSRYYGNLMLGGASSEKYSDVGFHLYYIVFLKVGTGYCLLSGLNFNFTLLVLDYLNVSGRSFS